jgi:hypothetical protein
MTPFMEFRVWLRRGPTGERVVAGLAFVLALALAVWAVIPVDYDKKVTAAASDDNAARVGAPSDDLSGTEDTTDTTAVSGEATSGAATRQPSGSTNVTTSTDAQALNKCAGPLAATDQGVTAKEVLVAVAIISLGGDVGNETFGIRGDLEDVAKAAAAGINTDGGVGCRKMVIKIFRVNPLDQNDTRSKCLDIVAAKPFAVIDFGGYIDPVSRACFVENKLPFQSALAISEDEGKSSYPYLYTPSASADRQLRNWVFEAKARGSFDAGKGFKKLGLFVFDCEADSPGRGLIRDLRSVGVGDDKMSVFKRNCNTGGTPNELAQAMAQHRQDGVSHVLLSLAQIDAKSYVRNANQLGWKPVWLASDYGAITNTTSQSDWNNGFDGTIAITSDRSGEYNSGIRHKLVPHCQDWYKKANVPPPDKDGDAGFGFCVFFTLFKTAADASAPTLTRTSLLPNLSSKGGLFESVAYSDIMFDRPSRFSGGDQVRAIQWRLDCTCWKVVDNFRPAP